MASISCHQYFLYIIGSFVIWLAINIFGMLAAPDGVDYGAHIAGLLISFALKEKITAQNPIIELLNQPEAQLKR